MQQAGYTSGSSRDGTVNEFRYRKQRKLELTRAPGNVYPVPFGARSTVVSCRTKAEKDCAVQRFWY